MNYKQFLTKEINEGKLYYHTVNTEGRIFYMRDDMIPENWPRFNNFSDANLLSLNILNGWELTGRYSK